MIAGFTTGTRILNRIAILPHPSISAASSSSFGTPRKNCTSMKMKNAVPKNQGSTSAILVSTRFSLLRIMYCGTTMTCDGIINVTITQENQKFPPRNLILVNAYAASSEMNTQPTIASTVTNTVFPRNVRKETPATPSQAFI